MDSVDQKLPRTLNESVDKINKDLKEIRLDRRISVKRETEQRWETLFEPHYTFSSSNKYTDPMIFREQGMERQASLILSHMNQSGNFSSQELSSTKTTRTTNATVAQPILTEDKLPPPSPLSFKQKQQQKQMRQRCHDDHAQQYQNHLRHHRHQLSLSSLSHDINDYYLQTRGDKDEDASTLNSISVASSPTLPRIEHLMLHTLPAMDQPHQVAILPCPSQSLDELRHAHGNSTENIDKWKERLNLLNSIYQDQDKQLTHLNFANKTKDGELASGGSGGTHGNNGNPAANSTENTSRRKEKRKNQTSPSLSVTQQDPISWWRHYMQRALKPYRCLRAKMVELREESKLPFFTTQLLMQQELEKKKIKKPWSHTVREKGSSSQSSSLPVAAKSTPSPSSVSPSLSSPISLHKSSLHIQHCTKKEEQDPLGLKKYRLSFLYFIFGFLFPPLWILGALYMKRSEEMTKADIHWRKRSQHALTIFLVIILLTILSVLIFKPSALGWRHSSVNDIPPTPMSM